VQSAADKGCSARFFGFLAAKPDEFENIIGQFEKIVAQFEF
jgi:hypothetical protein